MCGAGPRSWPHDLCIMTPVSGPPRPGVSWVRAGRACSRCEQWELSAWAEPGASWCTMSWSVPPALVPFSLMVTSRYMTETWTEGKAKCDTGSGISRSSHSAITGQGEGPALLPGGCTGNRDLLGEELRCLCWLHTCS